MARRTPYHHGQWNGASDSVYVENENDQLVNGLRNKVGTLRSLTLDMGDEIKSQNSILGDMDSEFDSVWGKLSSSMSRVTRLAKAGHNRYILYLIGFSFFVFFVIYVIMKTK
ncbi:BET1 -like protein [Halotydeus destructor]|nr:BET1 -like protein [Halotydeus destructor]